MEGSHVRAAVVVVCVGVLVVVCGGEVLPLTEPDVVVVGLLGVEVGLARTAGALFGSCLQTPQEAGQAARGLLSLQR